MSFVPGFVSDFGAYAIFRPLCFCFESNIEEMCLCRCESDERRQWGAKFSWMISEKKSIRQSECKSAYTNNFDPMLQSWLLLSRTFIAPKLIICKENRLRNVSACITMGPPITESGSSILAMSPLCLIFENYWSSSWMVELLRKVIINVWNWQSLDKIVRERSTFTVTSSTVGHDMRSLKGEIYPCSCSTYAEKPHMSPHSNTERGLEEHLDIIRSTKCPKDQIWDSYWLVHATAAMCLNGAASPLATSAQLLLDLGHTGRSIKYEIEIDQEKVISESDPIGRD